MAKTKKRKKNRNSAKVTVLLVCLVLLTAGIIAIFVLDSGSKSGVREIEATTFGIDVARYQGTIDWAEAAENGVEFAMVRLGYRDWSPEKSWRIPTPGTICRRPPVTASSWVLTSFPPR